MKILKYVDASGSSNSESVRVACPYDGLIFGINFLVVTVSENELPLMNI